MSWLERLARPGCPPGWKLTRAVSEAADPRTEWHLIRCERCAAEFRALQDLAQDAKTAAPVPEKLSREAREGIGTRLRAVAAAAVADQTRRERATRRGLIWVALLVPAVVTVVFWMSRRADHAVVAGAHYQAPGMPMTIGDTRATIRAIGPARFSRAQFQPDEIVRLDDGEIELEIAPLHAHERFRVVTDDGEVEVRGTRFKVSVIDHHLAGVHVWKGLVEVRSSGGAQAMLAPGDDWVRESSPTAAPPLAEPAAPPTAREPDESRRPRVKRQALAAVRHHAKMIAAVVPGPKPLPAARDQRPMTRLPSFGHAWSLLRSGDAKAAAQEFSEVERLAHGRDIEEDALYWRAVAVQRAGDSPGARTLFAGFLERFPSSSRTGEAAAALGGLLLDAGDRHGAHRAFERAARDPSPQVRASAQDGLRRTRGSEP